MTKKIKKYKVGIDSETTAISLVSEPAICVDFVALSKQEEKNQIFLEKDSRYMVYGPALIPNFDIYRNNGEQEFYINFTEEAIIKMSQEYMKDFKQYNVTLQHEETVDEVCLVESWIIEDSYKDKANALGFDLPKGSWMIGMKVNNVDTWNRIKDGELKGFSIESLISLEEFSKQNSNNMTIETNDMNYWAKFKEVLREVFNSNTDEEKLENSIEPIELEALEAQEPTPSVEPTPTVEPQAEPSVEPTPNVEPQSEPTVEEPKADEPKPTVDNSHLEELISTLKAEIEALKESNNGLQEKIKDMGKQPSAQPLNTNAKPQVSSNYSAWREQMRNMLG